MKTRISRGLVALVLTMASMAAMASMASAQVVITDSGNGTGNTINAGGGFGPTEIYNSGNGDYNTINAEPSYRHAVEPQRYYRTYTVRREVSPSYTTWQRSYPTVTRYHGPPKVLRYAYATPPAPYVDQVPYAVPQRSYPARTWSSRTEIRDSGNGTDNTINASGGFGASVIDSGNGEGNTINIGR